MEYDVFSYGFSIVSTYFIYLLILVPFSILNEDFFETIIFLIVFTSLRQYLGGLHFNSSIKCMIASLFVGTILPILGKYMYHIILWVQIICFLFTFIIIHFIGTNDHHNKRLDDQEKITFKIKANKTLLFYFIFVMIFYSYIPKSFTNTIILTILLMNFNLIIPSIK